MIKRKEDNIFIKGTAVLALSGIVVKFLSAAYRRHNTGSIQADGVPACRRYISLWENQEKSCALLWPDVCFSCGGSCTCQLVLQYLYGCTYDFHWGGVTVPKSDFCHI